MARNGYVMGYDVEYGDDCGEGDDEDEFCPVCGGYMDWTSCWACMGEGVFDMYERLPLEYDPGDVEVCEECHGEGGYLECTSLSHK